MKHLTEVLTGLLVIIVGASLTGNFQSLLGLALMSITCTAGIGLVVWIPLCDIIGSLSLAVIRATAAMFSDSGRKEEGAPEQKGAMLKEQMAIEQYIDRAKFYGLSNEQILSALKNGGWSDVEIQAAYGGRQRL